MHSARLTSVLAFLCLAAPLGAQQGPIEPAAEAASAAAIVRREAFTAIMRDSIAVLARTQIGRRYVFGGEDPQFGFDCSGLVLYVMSVVGVDLPRTARQQARVGWEIARDTSMLHPGDLLLFGDGDIVEHIGIYVGDGRFVHASSVAGEVIESAVLRPPAPLIKPWIGARRLTARAP